MSDAFDTDVVIIGYGPSGVSAANFLGARGVGAIAVERWTDIYRRARAVTTNDWTLRCFQSVGLDAALKAKMDRTHSLRWLTYDGQELNRIGFPGGQLGHYQSYSIYQPVMEQVLRDGAARYADRIAVHYGVDATAIAQDGDGVTVTTTDLSGGTERTIRARYVLACDGGSSATRERLGIALLGDTVEQKWVVIDAKVKRWWPDRHILTFWSDRQRPAVDIALSQGTHRWELPLKPGETEDDLRTADQLWPLLNAMGVTESEVEIDQHAFYKHHIRSAERWREGRVFLVGDAAHLMPPWAGQGMQSGIRDAFNLSWKLAEVLAGRLDHSALDTYQPERAPDVERYTQISIGLGRIIRQELSEAELGAMRPPPGVEPPPPPLLEMPVLRAGWLSGGSAPGSAVGKMIPQPRVARSDGVLGLLDDVIGSGFTLLGDNLDPASLLCTAERDAWDRLDASYRAVRSSDRRSEAAADIVDIEGTLLAWMRGYGARAIAVRPDFFVAAADPGGLKVPLPIAARENSKRMPTL